MMVHCLLFVHASTHLSIGYSLLQYKFEIAPLAQAPPPPPPPVPLEGCSQNEFPFEHYCMHDHILCIKYVSRYVRSMYELAPLAWAP